MENVTGVNYNGHLLYNMEIYHVTYDRDNASIEAFIILLELNSILYNSTLNSMGDFSWIQKLRCPYYSQNIHD